MANFKVGHKNGGEISVRHLDYFFIMSNCQYGIENIVYRSAIGKLQECNVSRRSVVV